MEMEEVEAVLERVWDLHDKVSDAIHATSRAHFLCSINSLPKSPTKDFPPTAKAARLGRVRAEDGCGGFVLVKDFKAAEEGAASGASMAEAMSLRAIRTALENLEDQLEFLHAVQSQQRAEVDAAIARLEQSRLILAKKLVDHQGKRYNVIEEALTFVGDVQDMGSSKKPEFRFGIPRNWRAAFQGRSSNLVAEMLLINFSLAKSVFKFDRFGGVVGNAAIFAASMLALMQIHQVAFRNGTKQMKTVALLAERNRKNMSNGAAHFRTTHPHHLEVWFARG